MPIPVVDYVFAAVLAVSMLLGAWRGLVFEVLSVLNWISAFFLAQWFATDVALMLPLEASSETVRYAAGFIVVFVANADLVYFSAGKPCLV